MELEKQHIFEENVLSSLKKSMSTLVTLQSSFFSKMESIVEIQRDLDLDVMSMFEQELDTWKTIAFEGPRSEKGLSLKKNVNKVKKRRIDKIQKKEESSGDFDGRISENVWKLFVRATRGVVGRGRSSVVGPMEFREEEENREEDDANEGGGGEEEEKMTLFVEDMEVVEEDTKKKDNTILLEEQEEEVVVVVDEEEPSKVVSFSSTSGLNMFRRQFVAHQQIKDELKMLIKKRIKERQQQDRQKSMHTLSSSAVYT